MTSVDGLTPSFALSVARSGSTLLRLILDTHPRVWCPGELGLGALCRHLLAFFDSIPDGSEPLGDGIQASVAPFRRLREFRRHPSWSNHWPSNRARKGAIECTRDLADQLMSARALETGARVWCERTPENIEELDVLLAVYPDARYICLYRDGLDVAHSMVAGAQFGIRSDFAPIIARDPMDYLGSALEYWLDGTEATMRLEDQLPGQVHRIRYEDILTAPESVLPGAFEFLGLEWIDGLVDRVYTTPHDPGIGSTKAHVAGKLDPTRVGEGRRRIPEARISSPLRARLDARLTELGYEGLPAK